MIYAQIGTKKIALDESLGDNPEDIRDHLRVTFPELANSDVRTKQEDGHTVIEFTAKVGRKG